MEKIKRTENQESELDWMADSFRGYERLFALTPEDLEKSILDVGTGDGGFIFYLRQVLNNKKSFGVELNTDAYPNRKEADFIITADGLDLPFEDESFEIVTAKHYLPMFIKQNEIKMKKAITELLRVLKPGGKIIANIITPEETQKDLEDFDNYEHKDKFPELRDQYKTKHEQAVIFQEFLEEMFFETMKYNIIPHKKIPEVGNLSVITIEKIA